MIELNDYLSFILDYSKNNTPITLTFAEQKYYEILRQISNKPISSERKKIITAVYTLIYTAINLNNEIMKSNCDNISYNILLADYIYSYCTEVLYKKKETKILKVFASNAKKVLLDTLHGRDTSYFLEQIINNLE